MKQLIPLLIISALFYSCATSQEEPVSKRIQGLTDMAELGTVEYTVTKMILADDAAWYKYGKRKILFSCKAYIKAGIDMREFSADSINDNLEKKSISMILPKAKILSFNMPPEDIKEELSIVTGLRDKFTPEQKQYLLTLGENDIREDIPNMGIIEDAQANAKAFFMALLTQLGYESISIKFE